MKSQCMLIAKTGSHLSLQSSIHFVLGTPSTQDKVHGTEELRVFFRLSR